MVFCNLAPIVTFQHCPITYILSFIAIQLETLMMYDMQFSDITVRTLKWTCDFFYNNVVVN